MRIRTSFILSIVLLILLSFSCGNRHSSSSHSGLELSAKDTIYVDIDKSLDVPVSFGDLFTDLEIVSLDTVPDATLNLDYLCSWDCSGREFFFVDNSEIVRIFDISGRWMKNLNKKGRAGDEYVMAYDILVNNHSNTLDVLDPTGSILQYSLEDYSGAKIRCSNVIRAPWSFAVDSLGNYLLFSQNDDSCRIALFDVKHCLSNRFNYNIEQFLFDFGPLKDCHYYYDGGIRFLEKSSGTIFDLDFENYNAVPVYAFDFGKYTFNPDFVGDKDTGGKSMLNHIRWFKNNSHKYVITFLSACETRSSLFLSFVFRHLEYTLQYDKNTKRLILFHRLKEGVRVRMGKIFGDYMYSVVRPSDIMQYVNEELVGKEALDEIRRVNTPNYYVLKYTVK